MDPIDRTTDDSVPDDSALSVLDLIYLGFNRRVVALHRETGEVVWDWKAPKGSGFVAVMLDGEIVIASVQGYIYGLDAVTGGQLWFNPLTGYGLGTPSLASIRSSSGSTAAAAAIIAQQRTAAAGGAAAAGS